MKQLDEITSVLTADPAIEFAYLFGSRAQEGRSGPASDWDIAVYLKEDQLQENPVWQKFGIEDRLSAVLRTDAVEVVILNRLDDPLLGFEIISRGVLLSCKNDDARIIFEVETLRRYQDWQYFSRRHMGLAEAA